MKNPDEDLASGQAKQKYLDDLTQEEWDQLLAEQNREWEKVQRRLLRSRLILCASEGALIIAMLISVYALVNWLEQTL